MYGGCTNHSLTICSVSSSVDPENCTKAKGYLASLNEPVNVFIISFMMDFLSLLDILNKAFQKSDSSLPTSLSILKSARENLNDLYKYTIEHIAGLFIQKALSLKKINLAHPGKERG